MRCTNLFFPNALQNNAKALNDWLRALKVCTNALREVENVLKQVLNVLLQCFCCPGVAKKWKFVANSNALQEYLNVL